MVKSVVRCLNVDDIPDDRQLNTDEIKVLDVEKDNNIDKMTSEQNRDIDHDRSNRASKRRSSKS